MAQLTKPVGFIFESVRRAGNAERLLFFSQYALLLLLSPHVPLTAVSEVLPVVLGGEQRARGPCWVYSAERAAAVLQRGAPWQSEMLFWKSCPQLHWPTP